MEMNVETVKELIASLNQSGVNKLSLETQDFKLLLEKGEPVYVAAEPAKQGKAEIQAHEAIPAEPENPCGNIVTSPIVGTFYASASPDKPPFVKLGQRVKKGDTLFVVESMKLMNEITSEFDGIVAEIFAKNGAGLEYGQSVMRIE